MRTGRWAFLFLTLALGAVPQAAVAAPRACIPPGDNAQCARDSQCCAGAVCAGVCRRGCKIDRVFYDNGAINPPNDCQWCQGATNRFGWTNRPATTLCESGLSQGGVCDGVDHCDGTAPTCVDVFKGSETTCRDAVNACDVAEVCSGTSGSCTAPDGFAASSTPCSFGESNNGVCDGADHCDGNAATCVDVFKGSETTCRPAVNACDLAEVCSGTSGSCTAPDGFAASSAPCTFGLSNGSVCDGADHCDGNAAACVDVYKGGETTCRPAAGECDVAENCTGSSGACPPDGFEEASVYGVGVCTGQAAKPCDVSCKLGDCGEITMECGEVKYCGACKGESPNVARSNSGNAASSFSYYWADGCAIGLWDTVCEGDRDPYRCCTGPGEGSCHNKCLNSAGTSCSGDADCATGWCECYGDKNVDNTCDSSGGICRLPRITASCYADSQCDSGIELHDSGARCRDIGDTGLKNCQPLPGQNGEACEFPWVVLPELIRGCFGGTRKGEACSALDLNPTTGCPGCDGNTCGPFGGCRPARFCQSGSRLGLFCTSDSECPDCSSDACCVQALPLIYCFEKRRCAGGTRNGAICSTIQLRSDGTADPDKGCPGCEDGSCGADYGCNVDIDWEQVSSAQCESGLCARNAVATGGPLLTEGSVCCRDLDEACDSDSDCCKGSGTLCMSADPVSGQVEGYTLEDSRIRRCVDDGTGNDTKVCKKVKLLGETCTESAECWGHFDIVCSGGVCTSDTYTPRPQGASCSTIGDTAANPQQDNVPTKFFPCVDGLECRDCTGKNNGWRCAPPEKICVGGTDNGKACGNPRYVCDGGDRDRQACSPSAPLGAACPNGTSCECISGCSACPDGACTDNPDPGCCSSGPTPELGGQDFDLSNLSDPGECPNRTNPNDLGRCCNFGCKYLRTDPDNCGFCDNRCSEPARYLNGGRACWVADDTTTCSEYKCNYQFRCDENQVCGGANLDGSPICVAPVLVAGTNIQIGGLPLYDFVATNGGYDYLTVNSAGYCDEDSDCGDGSAGWFCQKTCSLEPELKNAPPPSACTEVKGSCAQQDLGYCGDEDCGDNETDYMHDPDKNFCYWDCGYETVKGDGHCDLGETCRSSVLGIGTCDCGRCTIFDSACP